jgi:hypothetical protein
MRRKSWSDRAERPRDGYLRGRSATWQGMDARRSQQDRSAVGLVGDHVKDLLLGGALPEPVRGPSVAEARILLGEFACRLRFCLASAARASSR